MPFRGGGKRVERARRTGALRISQAEIARARYFGLEGTLRLFPPDVLSFGLMRFATERHMRPETIPTFGEGGGWRGWGAQRARAPPGVQPLLRRSRRVSVCAVWTHANDELQAVPVAHSQGGRDPDVLVVEFDVVG